MINNYLIRPRRKAFLGSIIGGIFGIGTSIYSASEQKKAQEKQYALQRNTQLRNTGLTSAANLNQAFANYDELDEEFRNRFMKFGGRKKFAGGGEKASTNNNFWNWSANDTNALISGLGSAGSNLATALVGQAQQQAIYPDNVKTIYGQEKDNEAKYDSAARSEFLNNYYRTAMMRMGGRRR